MNKKNIILYILLSFITFTSCSEFLDETPDNRIELDSNEKIRALLTSAYSTSNFIMMTELASDNIDDFGLENPNTIRSYDEMAYWEDVAGAGNDDPVSIWGNAYEAIAHSNQALDAIKQLNDIDLSAEKGEALITRAYNHFVLVNLFARHYNSSTSDSDLGIPYLEVPETELDVKYERESVSQVYAKIEKDILEALPLINDAIYQVKTYHFNRSAAFAFAARFYLYYGNWQKAAEYATVALNNGGSLRNWSFFGTLPREEQVVANQYITDLDNFLVQTSISSAGQVFGGFFTGSRFNHTRFIADNQTLFAPLPWSAATGVTRGSFNFEPFIYTANNLDKSLFYKTPRLFEITDPVAGIGFLRTVTVPFTYDEALLIRAEAFTNLGQYDNALADINTWSRNFYSTFPATDVTLTNVNDFYNGLDYSKLTSSTGTGINQKKELSPDFPIRDKDHENMLHYVLQSRRVLTLHEGLRWFDIKRYGIEVPRYVYGSDGSISEVDVLGKSDPRKALQIPNDVISAGLTPNPR
ncbi:RagB/SusD family nutrient uptake outer membrane protein [Tenacibaculum sp. M341]|uniref:RagB/SusD family nutrient uptake outer membrane protein n=1 Tax=Tenacibaculum sp. M341 TaxID=2530339 RepID=UPI00104782FC|nr:RagB/SusD family nutrient uptake outer membrane protein [Tenacibaculum sp. M341]TCI85916.1 RagB/SusD family nutrient uptake outer membrane protein [Tenacibaculum sp. M341]